MGARARLYDETTTERFVACEARIGSEALTRGALNAATVRNMILASRDLLERVEALETAHGPQTPQAPPHSQDIRFNLHIVARDSMDPDELRAPIFEALAALGDVYTYALSEEDE